MQIRIKSEDQESYSFPQEDVEGRREDDEEQEVEGIRERIERVTQDLKELGKFYNIASSARRTARFENYYNEELAALSKVDFEVLKQGGKVDYLLLKSHLERNRRKLGLDAAKDKKLEPLLPFADTIIQLCEERQLMKPMVGKSAAKAMNEAEKQVARVLQEVVSRSIKLDKTSAFRAATTVDKLQGHLAEWFTFYNGYDPLFSWWVAEPYAKLNKALGNFSIAVKMDLVGIKPGEEDAIVGDPIGRDALVAELQAESIPYTPEELCEIGEKEYVWCENEMKKAAKELDPRYAEDWRAALEHVKTLYVDPGKQTELIKFLADEATDYVIENDMVTVPPIANETWRQFMMTPARQKVNPFFLGGDAIIVSYPTDTMDHEDKMMSMRGNNIHFSRSTVFHELIPGHHLQFYYMRRSNPYRRVFSTPFNVEGWSLYWELILWNRKFPATPENKIGMLFWRMHRCARIIFSLKFHLGLMDPQECIDLLVDWVGHERATAEGEVRRSFAGDYSPLYQAGYLLGGLQILSLREEVVENGTMTEKAFHDRYLKEGNMPIELLRALLKKQKLTSDFETSWRFYD